MQNFWDQLFYLYDSSGDRFDQGWPTRSSLIHGLQHQGKLTYLTLGKKVKWSEIKPSGLILNYLKNKVVCKAWRSELSLLLSKLISKTILNLIIK